MSTYAALVSLHQIVEALIDPGGLRIYDRDLLQSIHEKVTSLLHSLENSGSEISLSAVERNTRLREAAYKAEDAIESQVSTILGSDRKRSMINSYKTFCFILCAIGVLSHLGPPNPEGILDWIKFFLVFAGILYSSIYISRDISTRLANYILDKESRAQRTQDLNLVLNDFNLIAEDYESQIEEISAYAALISLRRTLDSALGSDGYKKYNRAQLKSLFDNVSFLLGTCLRHQESALDATIRDAAYKANSLIKFEIPAQFYLDSATIRFRRTMKLRFEALCMFVRTLFIWIAFHFHYDKPFMSFPQGKPGLVMEYTLHVCFSPPVLGVFTIFCLMRVAVAYLSGRVNVSEEFIPSEKQESEELRLVVDDLAESVNKIKDACGNPSSQQSSSCRRDLGGTGDNAVVGLERDLQQIKDHLLRDSSQREVISIVGMGGIGKTTLATQAYNDSVIRSHFDIRAWVSVSQEYSLRRVLLCILDSANLLTKEMQEEEDDSKLVVHLHKSLVSRRYLIVMDDVWDTKIWDSINIYFPENFNRSRILLTSRLTASFPKSSSLHQMQCLNDDQSWCLLREKVFGEQDRPLGLELESIGREIAQKCQGLPLAIVVIGGLLYKDNRREIWRDVARNLNSNLQAEVLEILGLSYNHLPHHLRPCFLYMGAFPGDSEIPVSKLISLWVAEGFLKPQTSKSLEEMAEEYLNDLNDRNLILVGKRSCNGKIRTCSIHDLLRDVCVQNAQKENFLQVVDSSGHLIRQSCGRITRRLSICVDALRVLSAIHNELISCYYVRSLLFTAGKLLNGTSVAYLILFQYLRVLDVVVMDFGEFPDDIIQLIHLRYLAFYYDGPIPPSISKLWNLQTIVHHCSHRTYPLLPGVIWSMPNLRHLYVKPGCYLSDPLGFRLPWKISILQHLLTLMGIRNFKWSKGIIKRIPNLKKLGIFYDVSSSVDWSTYQLECLVDLSQLEVLKITVNYDDLQSCDPPKLAFPQKLKKLSLSGCGIRWASMTTIGALPNLEALKLRREACSGPSWETVEGEFNKLMFLLLEQISFVSWETVAAHIPRLQRLVLRSCGMLEEIPRAIGDIPTLEMIELVGCLPSAVDSAKQIQEEQERMGNEYLKFRIC